MADALRCAAEAFNQSSSYGCLSSSVNMSEVGAFFTVESCTEYSCTDTVNINYFQRFADQLTIIETHRKFEWAGYNFLQEDLSMMHIAMVGVFGAALLATITTSFVACTRKFWFLQ